MSLGYRTSSGLPDSPGLVSPAGQLIANRRVNDDVACERPIVGAVRFGQCGRLHERGLGKNMFAAAILAADSGRS